MKNLQEARAHICDLKGSVMALETIICALVPMIPAEHLTAFWKHLHTEKESATATLLAASVSERTVAAYAATFAGLT